MGLIRLGCLVSLTVLTILGVFGRMGLDGLVRFIPEYKEKGEFSHLVNVQVYTKFCLTNFVSSGSSPLFGRTNTCWIFQFGILGI